MDNKKTLNTFFLFALFALMFVLLISMFYPFFSVILWTILLYILVKPLHSKCVNKLNTQKKFYEMKRHLLAGGFSVGILLFIIVPLIGACVLLVQQLISYLDTVKNFIQQNPDFFTASELGKIISSFVDKISLSFINFDSINIRNEIINFISQYSSKLISLGTSLVSNVGNFIISLLFIVFALYFCFLDGRYLVNLLSKAIPIDSSYMATLRNKFTEITRNLFSGYILVALYQGIAAFFIMLIFRVDGAFLFSVILMFASFIPLVGTAIVWIPIGIGLCATKSVLTGILFLIICGVCVSLIDNFLRPLFLKDRIKVHPLVIFFSILGGLKVFGMNGLLLGPMIVILFFTILDMLIISENKSLE